MSDEMTSNEIKPPHATPLGHDPEDDGDDSAFSDDVLGELPELDGDASTDVNDLDGGEGGPLALEGSILGEDENEAADAELLAEAIIDTLADLESESWETGEDDPVDADDELAEGEGELWSDERSPEALDPAAERAAFDEAELDTDPATPEDDGEEGFGDDLLGDIKLPTRPDSTKADEDESDVPGLDVWQP